MDIGNKDIFRPHLSKKKKNRNIFEEEVKSKANNSGERKFQIWNPLQLTPGSLNDFADYHSLSEAGNISLKVAFY